MEIVKIMKSIMDSLMMTAFILSYRFIFNQTFENQYHKVIC